MKPVNHVIVRLDDYKIKLGEVEIEIDTSYNPQEWVSTKGTVIGSSSPEIQEGDRVYLDYYNVLQCLGKKINPAHPGTGEKYIVDSEGIKIFVKPKHIFFVERGGSFLGVNNFELITPLAEKKSDSIIVLNEVAKAANKEGDTEDRRFKEEVYNGFAIVESGDMKGKKVVYKKGMFRNAGGYGYNSKDFYVIHKEYILAEVEDE